MTVLCTELERREWRQAGRGRFAKIVLFNSDSRGSSNSCDSRYRCDTSDYRDSNGSTHNSDCFDISDNAMVK